ncbi:calcium/sodium antiporter [Erythrobacteraceae bacterium CFH 75059]|nr:calcium/sodium antiporter [Erythrobacteraceae bacterium CFH 75059]
MQGAMLLGGLVLLIVGGELLVRGAVRIATRLGLSPMLIGLTIVGLGTSTPELVTSIQAARIGAPGIALGNIIGSNMANTLLILGVAALLAPVLVPRGVLWRDGGVGAAAAMLLLAWGWTAGLNQLAGGMFVVLLGGYIVFAYLQEKRGFAHSAAYDKAAAAREADPGLVVPDPGGGNLLVALALFVGGLALVVGGGALLVEGAVQIAAALGVTQEVIGLTVVAIGTSLPELVTSAIAALRRQGEIALGNVLGSNIYNILFIGGVTGLVAPGPVPRSMVAFDLPLLVAVSLGIMVLAWTGKRLSRIEGGVLVLAYASYIAFTAGLVRL